MAILVISVIASLAFASTAKKKGYDSPRIWIYPLAVGSGVYVAGFVLGLVAHSIIPNQESAFLKAYPYIIGLISILLLFALISKAWKQIAALPQK
jgi:hypothetical protein